MVKRILHFFTEFLGEIRSEQLDFAEEGNLFSLVVLVFELVFDRVPLNAYDESSDNFHTDAVNYGNRRMLKWMTDR
jgi:hypothetical protein